MRRIRRHRIAEFLAPSSTVVLVGMQSEYCIRETALAALHRRYSVKLIRGAHATYDNDLPAATVSAQVEQELSNAGVMIVDIDDIA